MRPKHPRFPRPTLVDPGLMKAAACDYKERIAVVDQTLYELCRQHPDHQTTDAVHAKTCLIGRAYATGIERRIESDGRQSSALSQLNDFLFKHRWQVDSILGELEGVLEPLEWANVRLIIAQHGRFTSLLSQLVQRRAVTSFAAKYMHFHNPAVPIYDRLSSSAARGILPWRDLDSIPAWPARRDPKYWRFAVRFWKLYQGLDDKSTGTVRLLDRYLVMWEERRRAQTAARKLREIPSD